MTQTTETQRSRTQRVRPSGAPGTCTGLSVMLIAVGLIVAIGALADQPRMNALGVMQRDPTSDLIAMAGIGAASIGVMLGLLAAVLHAIARVEQRLIEIGDRLTRD